VTEHHSRYFGDICVLYQELYLYSNLLPCSCARVIVPFPQSRLLPPLAAVRGGSCLGKLRYSAISIVIATPSHVHRFGPGDRWSHLNKTRRKLGQQAGCISENPTVSRYDAHNTIYQDPHSGETCTYTELCRDDIDSMKSLHVDGHSRVAWRPVECPSVTGILHIV